MRRGISVSIGIVLTLAALYYLKLALPPVQFAGIPRNAGFLSWQTYTSLIHNSFYQLPFPRIFSGSLLLRYESLVLSSLIFSGAFCCGVLVGRGPEFAPAIVATAVTLIPQALFGQDILVMRLSAAMVWMTVLLLLPTQRLITEHAMLALFSVLGLFSYCFLGCFTFVAVLLSLLLCFFLSTKWIESSDSRLVFFAITLILVASGLFMPVLPFPTYPDDARLVSLSGVSWFARPLIGPDAPIPVIERLAVNMLGWSLGKAFLVVSFLFFFVGRDIQSKRLFLTATLVSLLVLLDTGLPERYAQLAPLASIARVIPGLNFYPISVLALLFISLTFCFGFLFLELWSLFPLLVSVAVIITVVSRNSPLAARSKTVAWAVPASSGAFKFADTNITAPDSGVSAEAQRTLATPSLSLIRTFGSKLVLEKRISKRLRFRLINSDAVVLSASANDSHESLEQMLDRKMGTRWSSNTAHQDGHEWLHLSFPSEQKVRGISFMTGDFSTDFPRALRISSSSTCPMLQNYTPDTRPLYSEVVNYYPWQGSLIFSDDDLPYFSGQDLVRIVFPEAVSTRCLLIEQTGKDSHYDWSVAELRIALEPDY